jgi:hypothetical protein
MQDGVNDKFLKNFDFFLGSKNGDNSQKRGSNDQDADPRRIFFFLSDLALMRRQERGDLQWTMMS